ncbi:hypothetical protein GGR54DRAFT_611393 [Hypoxylon sp. NC1633]|nr:hypothetical protein GGR54DRAFT_611393 [Hypoxylon sp. NC1633]
MESGLYDTAIHLGSGMPQDPMERSDQNGPTPHYLFALLHLLNFFASSSNFANFSASSLAPFTKAFRCLSKQDRQNSMGWSLGICVSQLAHFLVSLLGIVTMRVTLRFVIFLVFVFVIVTVFVFVKAER